jgi:hypothetical protein
MIVTITSLVSVVMTVIGAYLFVTVNAKFYDAKSIISLLCYVAGMTGGLVVLLFTGV